MSIDFADSKGTPVATGQQDLPGYHSPSIVVLGTLVELTQQGTGANDEILNDGSQV